MKVNKHICFTKDKAPEFVMDLQEHNIPFEDTHGLLTLDILESSPYWETVHYYVQKYALTCLSETTFSIEEQKASDWLCVRSMWRNGYPQPESKFRYQEITYNNGHCEACGIGLQQINPFRIKTPPKWGKRCFMMLNWVEDEIFLNDQAKTILQENCISGVSFAEVKSKNDTCIMQGIYQLTINAESKPGLISGQSSVQNVHVCPVCGQTKYHPSGVGMLTFRKEALEGMPDTCKTSELFGWGKSAHRIILMRQSVYRVITDNHLDKGLLFSPINLVQCGIGCAFVS